MEQYTPTIGLEIHAELKTATKMFCSSRNAPNEAAPNTHVCPVCLAHPGTLPVVNKEAVTAVLRVGAAVGSELADYSEFDRKSYFYPDIPKGYQISQYVYPLVSKGTLDGVAITRVHLEEDTARSSHGKDGSLVDFNRAGVPLMELVTEPEIHDAKTASSFARELQLLLRTLGVSDANLEKGEMRVEANVSVSKEGGVLGTKVEVKNLNSFKAVEKAIAFEIERQVQALESGEKVLQETRGWNEDTQKTFSQRAKEGSTDYRYFPEPDIPKLSISDISGWDREALQASLPELPWEKRERLQRIGLKVDSAKALTADIEQSAYFDRVAALLGTDSERLQVAANYLLNDIAGGARPAEKAFAELVEMIVAGEVSSRGAKELLKDLQADPALAPRELATEKQLLQNSDPVQLREIAARVLGNEQSAVAEYHAGKDSALQYLVGGVMRASGGSANPVVVRAVLIELLAQPVV